MNILLKRHNGYTTSLHLKPKRESRILELCESGLLTEAIRILNSTYSGDISVKPNLYASLLQTCIKVLSFNHGLQLHAHIIKSGLEADRFVGNGLLALYFKLGPDFRETQRIFDGLFFKDAVSWASIISGCVRCGKPLKALEMFMEMLSVDIEPSAFTLSSVIKACSGIGDLRIGRCFHGSVITRGLGSNHVICNVLAGMYGGNQEPEGALRVFDEMPEPDTMCWTSVVSAFTRNDLYEEALGLFYSMHRKKGLMPDGFTFGTVLTACGNLGRLRQGKEMHGKVITSGMCGNVGVESSLVDMYGKCGSVSHSKRVFDRMSTKNSVSWSALLGGYCQNGDHRKVVKMFRGMGEKDLYCFGTVLRACAGLAAVRHGKELHCQYIRRGGCKSVIVESALVDLYAKCGCVDFAHRVFSKMSVRNMITWNAMLCGLAHNGRGKEALRFFEEMIKQGVEPDCISFVGVLFACSHAGLVDEGRKHFALMFDKYGIRPGTEHYSCMVDLLGRAGFVEEAENLLEKADCRDDPYLWGGLLGACIAFTEDSVIAERVAKRMMELEPKYHMSYVLLANKYNAMGRHRDALEIRTMMGERRVEKTHGKSWIETH